MSHGAVREAFADGPPLSMCSGDFASDEYAEMALANSEKSGASKGSNMACAVQGPCGRMVVKLGVIVLGIPTPELLLTTRQHFGGDGGGVGTPATRRPPLKDWAKLSSGPSVNQKP